MPLWWTGKSVAEGFNWLTGKMKAHEVGEWFSSYQDAKPKFRPDMLMLEDLETALRTGAEVTRQSVKVDVLEKAGSGWNVMTDGGRIAAKEVIVAAGAFTDQLLGLSGLPLVGVKALRGRALILQLNHPLKTKLPYTYMTRPYTHYTLRPWRDGQLRLGDTVERSSKGGDAAIQELYRVAALLAPGAEVVGMLDGLRPVCDKAICRPISDGLIVMTGGHRVGLSMSQPFASAALRILERRS
jgi:glycine/D-amino acid oxidase-like deaminating enzyme